MPGKKRKRRIHLWVDPRHEKILDQIENHSKFFELCLDQAAGIMAWALLKAQEPAKYDVIDEIPKPEQAAEYNAAYPLNPLTKRRKQLSESSVKPQENW